MNILYSTNIVHGNQRRPSYAPVSILEPKRALESGRSWESHAHVALWTSKLYMDPLGAAGVTNKMFRRFPLQTGI